MTLLMMSLCILIELALDVEITAGFKCQKKQYVMIFKIKPKLIFTCYYNMKGQQNLLNMKDENYAY